MSNLLGILVWCCALGCPAALTETQLSHVIDRGVKNLTENFEGTLEDIKSQKNDTAVLHEETRDELGATLALKEETDEALKMLMTGGGSLEAYKNETKTIIAGQSEKIRELEEYTTNVNQLMYEQAEKIEDHAEFLEKLKYILFQTPIQAYLSFGLAGLFGRAVNLENGYYRGEFLYLARKPTKRHASLWHDAATLAVGAEGLRESAWLWEFVPIPGGGSLSFYLRNKLNEQNPLASTWDNYGRWNYISLEVVSSPGVAHSNQLRIYMKQTYDKEYYYHPHSTPNTDSSLNGRAIWSVNSHSYADTEWIVHFAS